MTNVPRVVVDTNVLISGLFGITDSPSSKILQAIRNKNLILVTSPTILEEIKDVLSRKRITKLTKMKQNEQADFVEELIERSDVTVGKQLSSIVGRDARDDKFLACAVEGNAEYIISGDKDLLTLKEFKGITIISPREFVNLIAR